MALRMVLHKIMVLLS